MSGIMSITGEAPGKPPVKCGAPLTDITCGILAAMGILAAYAHRLRTGRGQMVDTSLLEAGIVQTYWQSAIARHRRAPGPRVRRTADRADQAFETADGWIVIGGSNQKNWLSALEALGAEPLAADPRFARTRDRMATSKELRGLRANSACAPARSCSPLEAVGVPAGPIYDVAADARRPAGPGARHGGRGRARAARAGRDLGSPVKFSDTPGRLPLAPPSSASTPARSCAPTGSPTLRSRPSSPTAQSRSPIFPDRRPT